ncbi:translation machinery-associated protein 16, partial [Spiromyces aspiralis]
QKFLWFRDNLDESICPYTREDLAILIKAYLARNDDEIKEILEQRRPGRPLTPKQQLILTAAETERKEAMRGALDVPNLMDVKTLKLLHNWDGDMNSMHMITETRIKVDLGQDSDNDGDSGSKARSASNISEIDKAIETETGMLVA